MMDVYIHGRCQCLIFAIEIAHFPRRYDVADFKWTQNLAETILHYNSTIIGRGARDEICHVEIMKVTMDVWRQMKVW
jgi:hypothetical protein